MKVRFVALHDAVEGELRDGKHFSTDIHHRSTPGLAFLAGPQPHIEGLADHVLDHVLVIPRGEPHQHQHALFYARNLHALHLDPPLEHSLYHYPHQLQPQPQYHNNPKLKPTPQSPPPPQFSHVALPSLMSLVTYYEPTYQSQNALSIFQIQWHHAVHGHGIGSHVRHQLPARLLHLHPRGRGGLRNPRHHQLHQDSQLGPSLLQVLHDRRSLQTLHLEPQTTLRLHRVRMAGRQDQPHHPHHRQRLDPRNPRRQVPTPIEVGHQSHRLPHGLPGARHLLRTTRQHPQNLTQRGVHADRRLLLQVQTVRDDLHDAGALQQRSQMIVGISHALITIIRMGQCLQVTVSESKPHPLLGALQQLQLNGRPLLRLHCALPDEDHYIAWSKRINKLRYTLEIRDCLYLPTAERFHQGQGLCEGTSQLELTFDAYVQTLAETLLKNQKNRRYFQESFLWYLIYVLTKYVKYLDKKQENIGRISLDHLLLAPDGSLRIVPHALVPETEIDTLFLDSDDDSELTRVSARRSSPSRDPHPVYLMGLMCLSLADLLPPTQSYDPKTCSWLHLPPQTKRQSLKNCEKRYSALLVQTLSEMLQPIQSQRIRILTLYKRLQVFQTEITAKKQLGIWLGQSGVDSAKTSYYVENRTMGTLNNNSNLLRISEVSAHSHEWGHRGDKFQQQLLNTSEDYMHIL